MQQEYLNDLKGIGMDEESVFERVMDSEDLLEQLLALFVVDENFKNMCKAIDDNNVEEAFSFGHTFKGIAGNLSLMNITDIFIPPFEMLRQKEIQPIKDALPAIKEQYEKTIETIKKHYDPNCIASLNM